MRRVIADNLAAHHVGGVQQLIEAAGAQANSAASRFAPTECAITSGTAATRELYDYEKRFRLASVPAGFRGLRGERRPLLSSVCLGRCCPTLPPQFNGRLALTVVGAALGALLVALGVIGMLLPTYVALNVLGCPTRVPNLFRRGF